MTKLSASTLSRRAAQTKNPALAKRYRTQAAKLRRDERLARVAKMPHSLALEVKRAKMTGLPEREQIIKRVNKRIADGEHSGIVAGLDPVFMQGDNAITGHTAVKDAQRSLNQMRAASVDSMTLREPGHGEIVGGYLAARADVIAGLARKKGGTDAIQAELRAMQISTRAEAMYDANQRIQKTAQEANEQWRKNIVTGFMARMQGLEQMGRNGLPDAVVVDGVTLARVVDALSAAGYTPTGKR